MNLIVRVLLTAIAVVLLAKLFPGVAVEGFTSAIVVAIIIGLLNVFVKPILVILTLPYNSSDFGTVFTCNKRWHHPFGR